MKRIKRNMLCTLVSMYIVALFAIPSAQGTGTSHRAAPHSEPGGAAYASDSSKVETDQYVVELKADSTYPQGQECRAEVIIRPKANYHLDLKYPIRFTVGGTDRSVMFDKVIVKAEDGKVTEKDGSLPLVFRIGGGGREAEDRRHAVFQRHQ